MCNYPVGIVINLLICRLVCVSRLSSVFKNCSLKQSIRKQLSLLLSLHKESCVLLTQLQNFRFGSRCKHLLSAHYLFHIDGFKF